MERTRITIYGCEHDEVALFRKVASRLEVIPTITDIALSEHNVNLAFGSKCISISHKTQVSRPILRALSEAGVRYISTRSAGYNHIDVGFAASVGITVGNVMYSPDSVADYTLMLMLMVARNAKSTLSRADNHDFRLNQTRGKELRDMTIGVIGTGRIGTAVIDRLRGFGCRLVAYDHRPKTSVDYVPLDELLQISDIVTLHAPLTVSTEHLLNRRRIAQMKKGALIINTARGALIDTEALIAALEGGNLGGAALDVLEGEEGIFYTDHRGKRIKNTQLLRLQELPNVVITPHTSYHTEHALNDMVQNSIINCLKFEKERVAWINQKEKVV